MPDAGIIEEHIEPAISVHSLLHHSFGISAGSNITVDKNRFATHAFDELGGSLRGVRVDILDHQLRTLLGKHEGSGLTDPTSSPGNQGYFVGKSHGLLPQEN